MVIVDFITHVVIQLLAARFLINSRLVYSQSRSQQRQEQMLPLVCDVRLSVPDCYTIDQRDDHMYQRVVKCSGY